MDGSDPFYATTKDQRSVDRQAPQSDEETGLGRRIGAKKLVCRAEKHRLCHCPSWSEISNQLPEGLVRFEQRTNKSKEDWKWQRGITAHSLSESNWKRNHVSLQKWESEKHNIWKMSAERFRDHVANDGSSLGVSGSRRACGRSVVQLDHDEEMRPMCGMYGTLDAELEVERMIKIADSTVFLCFLWKATGTTMVHVENKGSFMVCGEETWALAQEQRMPICGSFFWKRCFKSIKKAYWWNSSTLMRTVPRRRSRTTSQQRREQ